MEHRIQFFTILVAKEKYECYFLLQKSIMFLQM